MSGSPSSQPGETTKVPETGVEAKGIDTASTKTGGVGEVVTNSTQDGRDRIAALLADSVDSRIKENSMS